MSRKRQPEQVVQEMVGFLSTPMFQIPVLTFMEDKCLTFDPADEKMTSDQMKLFDGYKKLVGDLLDGFRKDVGLTHDEIIQAFKVMNEKDKVRELYETVFEQVLATESAEVFQQMMASKNIELQQQALLVIMQTVGTIPVSLQGAEEEEAEDEEAKILALVIQQSKEDYIRERRRDEEVESDYERAIKASLADAERLNRQQHQQQAKMEETFSKMSLEGGGGGGVSTGSSSSRHMAAATAVTAGGVAAASSSRARRQEEHVKDYPPLPVAAPAAARGDERREQQRREEQRREEHRREEMRHAPPAPVASRGGGGGGRSASGQEAANSWLQSALTEANQKMSPALAAQAAKMSGMNAAELKKRQDFLRAQRDRLVAMKKTERAKTLEEYEKTGPKRPQSARAARNAMAEKGDSGRSAEDERKLAMRKALAATLKEEVIGKKD